MDFLREFDGGLWVPFWELLAVTGRLLGVLGVSYGASIIISPESAYIRPYDLFEPMLEQRNRILVEETRKGPSKKVLLR